MSLSDELEKTRVRACESIVVDNLKNKLNAISDAQDQGREAFHRGDEMTLNPYDDRDPQFDEWEDGYAIAEIEAQKAQWDKEAKELELYIYDNFYDDKDNLNKVDYLNYSEYLFHNYKDEYQQVIDENISLETFIEQQDGKYSPLSLFNMLLIKAFKEDLDNRLNSIEPSDYKESKEDIINNIGDQQRGMAIQAEIDGR